MEDEEDVMMKNSAKLGAITYQALQLARPMVREGAKLLDIAEKLEAYIREQGCGIAFPVNLSINEEAAHYTPKPNDERVFGKNDLVKIDLGCELEGALSDCAISVDISGNNATLVEASETALQNAIAKVKSGIEVSKIGREIEMAIDSYGFLPIKNLGGHGIEANNLHADPYIPNYDDGSSTTLEEGMIISLEPFATTGKGFVVSSDVTEIFEFVSEVNVRAPSARVIMKEIIEKYNKNPFAARWLSKVVDSNFALYSGLSELVRVGAIEPHPVLVESGKGLVSQTEVQLLIEKDGCQILTKT